MKYLKRHPFPVVARFDRVVAVSFAFPEEMLRPMVPAGLEIDGYEGFGFVTVPRAKSADAGQASKKARTAFRPPPSPQSLDSLAKIRNRGRFQNRVLTNARSYLPSRA